MAEGMEESNEAGHAYHLKDVGFQFGTTEALRAISTTIGEGESRALIGPSGCGKTTLLRVLGTHLAAGNGDVIVNGCDTRSFDRSGLRKLRQQIAFIPQGLGLVDNLRVIQNVVMGQAGQRSFLSSLKDQIAPSAIDRTRIFDILKSVGIPEKLYDRVDQLSHGQKQRAAIARALFQNPKIILADEPVSALDPVMAEEILQLLTDLCRNHRISLVVSIHNYDLARKYFDSVSGLNAGQLVVDIPASECSDAHFSQVFSLPKHDVSPGNE